MTGTTTKAQAQEEEEESIYNLISKNQINQCKKEQYKSKHNPKAPLVGSTFGLHGTTEIIGKGVHELKKSHVLTSTFGTITNPSGKKDFLKKGSTRAPKVGRNSSNFTRSSHCKNTIKKPKVPTKYDKPILGLKSCKDFVTFNAVEVISSNTNNTQQDSNSNHNNNHHEAFGKVPIYLQKIKSDIEKENELVDAYVQSALSDPRSQQQQKYQHNKNEYEQMNDKERIELINKLKSKWDKVNFIYQKSCHRVHMEYGDVRRKEQQEKELKQLEYDIILLTQPGPLFVEKL